jgi:hypothetical protein
MLAILAVFLVLGIGETIQGISATSTKDLGFRIGVGIGGAIVAALVVAVLLLLIGGLYYVMDVRKRGGTFREAIFNWAMVLVAGFLAFSGFLS